MAVAQILAKKPSKGPEIRPLEAEISLQRIVL
jgi:hypothetical protein